MGEIADYMIEQMMDEGYSPFSGREPKKKGGRPPAKFYDQRARGTLQPKQGKAKPRRTAEEEAIHAREYPGAHTDPALIPKYEEKTFDMSFFPKQKARIVTSEQPSWNDLSNEESPF